VKQASSCRKYVALARLGLGLELLVAELQGLLDEDVGEVVHHMQAMVVGALGHDVAERAGARDDALHALHG
jgi:hypothetical protein